MLLQQQESLSLYTLFIIWLFVILPTLIFHDRPIIHTSQTCNVLIFFFFIHIGVNTRWFSLRVLHTLNTWAAPPLPIHQGWQDSAWKSATGKSIGTRLTYGLFICLWPTTILNHKWHFGWNIIYAWMWCRRNIKCTSTFRHRPRIVRDILPRLKYLQIAAVGSNSKLFVAAAFRSLCSFLFRSGSVHRVQNSSISPFSEIP